MKPLECYVVSGDQMQYPTITLYISVFQPFCCNGTLHKCDDHSQNLMQWFMNPAVYRWSESFRVYGDRCPQRSQKVKNLWGLKAKHPKAEDKSASKILVEFDRIR